MRRTPRPIRTEGSPAYPDWKAGRCTHDASRRRFLSQLALGSAAVGVGLPRLGRSQSLEVDLSRLDGHPVTTAEAGAGPAGMAAPSPPPAAAPPAAAPPADAAAGMGAPLATAPTSAPTPVTERRALWVEPGYLLLIEWHRSADGTAEIAALEGAAGPVAAFLQGRVTTTDDLHQFDRLHRVEAELVGLLNGIVAPAVVQVLHLDHDCQQVCPLLGGTPTPPDPYPMPAGGMPAPGWAE